MLTCVVPVCSLLPHIGMASSVTTASLCTSHVSLSIFRPCCTWFPSFSPLWVVLFSFLLLQMDGSRSLTRGSTLVNRVSSPHPVVYSVLPLCPPSFSVSSVLLLADQQSKCLFCCCASLPSLSLLLDFACLYFLFFVVIIVVLLIFMLISFLHVAHLFFIPTIHQTLQYVSMKSFR